MAYYEIMDGPDPHVMITGFFRAGHTIQNLITFLGYAFVDKHDLKGMIKYGTNLLSSLSMDNAFLKFGQLQLDYQEVKQIWNTGEYYSAGVQAA